MEVREEEENNILRGNNNRYFLRSVSFYVNLYLSVYDTCIWKLNR